MKIVRMNPKGKWHTVRAPRVTGCGRAFRPVDVETRDARRKDEIFWGDLCTGCFD